MLTLLGLCRFSYPTLDGQGFRGPLIYDMDRLQRRLRLFEQICLPSIRTQTDPDFRLLVLVGEKMPLLPRLRKAVASIEQITVISRPEGLPHIETCTNVLCEHRGAASFVGEFCMDDDDAVAIDFIAETRDFFSSAQPIVAKGKPVELDFCRGFAAKMSGDTLILKQVVSPHWTPAQVIFQQAASVRSIFNYHHYRFWRRHDCLSVARSEPMFIRTFHKDNDSDTAWEPMKHEPMTRDAKSVLQARFGISGCKAVMAGDVVPIRP